MLVRYTRIRIYYKYITVPVTQYGIIIPILVPVWNTGIFYIYTGTYIEYTCMEYLPYNYTVPVQYRYTYRYRYRTGRFTNGP